MIPVPSALDAGEVKVPCAGVAFTNVNVTVADVEKKFVSPALEIDSEHVPILRAATRPAVNVQFAVPEVTDVETDPAPPPPKTDTMMPVNKSPIVVAAVNGD